MNTQELMPMSLAFSFSRLYLTLEISNKSLRHILISIKVENYQKLRSDSEDNWYIFSLSVFRCLKINIK